MAHLRWSTTAVVIGEIAIIAKGVGTTMIGVVRSTVTETVVDADFEPYHGARVNTAPVLGHRAFDEGGDAWLRGLNEAPKRARGHAAMPRVLGKSITPGTQAY
jgi:hypothetical protein